MDEHEIRLAQGCEIALRHLEATGQSPSDFDNTDAWWAGVRSWWQAEVDAGRQESPPTLKPKAIEYAKEIEHLLATT